MILGIDVSQVQGKIDWKAVADHGIRFALCKVTEGLYVDPTGLRNLDGAREAKIPCGAYLFVRVTTDPAAEAQRLWDSCGGVMPDLPVTVDFESLPKGMTPSAAVAHVEALIEEIENRFGRTPILYTYPAFARGLSTPFATSPILGRCKLHIAHYRWMAEGPPPDHIRPDVPMPWTRWTLWQYSGNGGARVPGIATDVDRNVFHGTEEEFQIELLGLDSDA